MRRASSPGNLRNKRVHSRRYVHSSSDRGCMLTRKPYLLCTLLVCFAASTTLAQASMAEFQQILREKASFEEHDLAAVRLNQPVVRLAPTTDKREVAVTGLVNINASAEDFLRSYCDSMLQKSNAAILEIGRFGP